MVECENCGRVVDGTATRWRCTTCGMKLNCCEGAPLPACERPA
ncbi:MAG TPA: hypothetical protein VLA97_08995 [Nocardioidaceae bacterium]|nr:hypothetical protein [Nocardioidaceae bacterium]